jgi:hypothetical protein
LASFIKTVASSTGISFCMAPMKSCSVSSGRRIAELASPA